VVASVELLGTVRPDDSLELDRHPGLPAGRVRVLLEPLAAEPARPAEGLVEFVQRLRREMAAAGHKFRTAEEIHAELAGLRDEWDDPPGRDNEPRGAAPGREPPEC
jgi:hypothetical protein